MIPQKGVEGYFAFLRERYRILLARRAGQAPPWTADPILQAWRFCNVRREDDKVTVWFRENIRDPLKDRPEVIFATIAFRWFNTIEAGKVLKPWLVNGQWRRWSIQEELEILMNDGVSIFTGAFMINSRPGVRKHIDVLDNLDWVIGNTHSPFFGHGLTEPKTKAGMMDFVLTVPRLGNFAAYQVVVDLQYTYLLKDAPDLNTFTVAGPGCAKGIGLCAYDDAEHFKYGSKVHQEVMLAFMRSCLAQSRKPEFWPSEWPAFYLSDIENGFCEYAKWRTGHQGLRLKRKFIPCS